MNHPAGAPGRPLLVSAISTNLPALQAHWSTSAEDAERPLGTLGSHQKPVVDLGGALWRSDQPGRACDVSMPSAAVRDQDGWLIAWTWGVARLDGDLEVVDHEAWDLPLLNAVHWLAPTRRGFLVVSSGLDLVLEVDGEGTVLWQWWAIDHGYALDPLGRARQIDRDADHRGVDYGTLANTTHVNSATELPDGSVLATLFHQGQVVRIDRSGTCRTLISGLDHPHAVRLLGDGRCSVVDTGRGRVIVFDPHAPSRAGPVDLPAISTWLQDACWDDVDRRWVLVDGRKPRVVLVPAERPDVPCWPDRVVIDLDPTWRLYAAVPFDLPRAAGAG